MPAFPDAEKISTQLVREAKLSTPPVDLWAISALWPNLRVSEEDLDKEGYLIFLGSHGAELLLRRSDPPNRKRFTFAHELGHWVLSNTRDGKIHFDSQVMFARSTHGARRTPEEIWCNEFASKLLLPTAEVCEFLRGPAEEVPIKLDAGHKEFDVSEDAFLFRITDITGWIIVHLVHGRNLHRAGKRYVRRDQNRYCVERLTSQLLEQTLNGPTFPISEGALSGFTAYGTLKSATRETSTYLVCLMPKIYGRMIDLEYNALA